jgi:serine/threonine protein kinase, bacterial
MGDTTADSREGSEFGPYRLRRLVGRGGMGDVYEAEDTVRERIVALKLMSPTLSSDPVFRSRMQREARTAGGCRNHMWCRSTTSARSTGSSMWTCA